MLPIWSPLIICSVLLVLESAHAVTREELQAATEDLQDGTLDAEGLDVFRQHAATNTKDWRAHGMLGQALAQKGLPGAVDALRAANKLAPNVGQLALAVARELRKSNNPRSATSEAAYMYRTALALVPTLGDADTYMQLGLATSDAATHGTDQPADDEALAAWSAAATLAPQWLDVRLLLARHLSSSGDKAQKARAIREGEAAVRLSPRSAHAYDALGGALLTATNPGNLTKKQRTRLVDVLRMAVTFRGAPAGQLDGDNTGVEAAAAALTHDRLARTLYEGNKLGELSAATEQAQDLPAAIDDDVALTMSEVVHHTREAARLDPVRYGNRARAVRGWEDTLNEYKQAERRNRFDREAMVKAMHAPFEEKRLQEEEDKAIAEEERLREEEEMRMRHRR